MIADPIEFTHLVLEPALEQCADVVAYADPASLADLRVVTVRMRDGSRYLVTVERLEVGRVDCPDCQGTGHRPGRGSCPHCHDGKIDA